MFPPASEFQAERITVRATDCPRISADFLEEEKRRLGALYQQEYECAWLAATSSIFSASALSAMFAKPVDEAFPIEDASEAAAEPVDWAGLLGSPSDEKTIKQRLWSF
jgi:hypothetical protein